MFGTTTGGRWALAGAALFVGYCFVFALIDWIKSRPTARPAKPDLGRTFFISGDRMKYRRRFGEVTAIRFGTRIDVPRILDLAGHWASDLGARGIMITTPDGGRCLSEGSWIVKESDSRFFVFSDAEFLKEFEEVGP